MALDTREFLAEMQQLQERKHSRKHPLFEMIEEGQAHPPEQLNGFIKQFYLLFPKPFPKPIAAMFARSPQDTELERMWFENLSEVAPRAARPAPRATRSCTSASPRPPASRAMSSTRPSRCRRRAAC